MNINKVQIELPSYILEQLLQSGLLHGGDCKCLNANAKQVLWHTLLATSLNGDLKKVSRLCA
ncbi:hypothetical protein NBRC116592_04700 [Colwellia sp. KU-HH00111]|uniref:hypothetical protein n=1 Tax=Colwellia sp. KU-HH00111 TaxID=3127652 RepID=UPI003104094C